MGRPPALPPADAPAQEIVPPVLAADGACTDSSIADLFYDEETYTEAVAVCVTCPVAAICREYGLRNETHGVWGGLTPEERHELRGGAVLLRVEDRRNADDIRAALAAGAKHDEVADGLGVHVRTIERWVAARRTVATAA